MAILPRVLPRDPATGRAIGARELVLRLLARVVALGHPTNASGNNRSQR